MNRRRFFTLVSGLLLAPAIVKAESLMPIKYNSPFTKLDLTGACRGIWHSGPRIDGYAELIPIFFQQKSRMIRVGQPPNLCVEQILHIDFDNTGRVKFTKSDRRI